MTQTFFKDSPPPPFPKTDHVTTPHNPHPSPTIYPLYPPGPQHQIENYIHYIPTTTLLQRS
jgi:hypothetical protein